MARIYMVGVFCPVYYVITWVELPLAGFCKQSGFIKKTIMDIFILNIR